MECRVAVIRLPEAAPACYPISPFEKTRTTLEYRLLQLPDPLSSNAIRAGATEPAFHQILGCDLEPSVVLTTWRGAHHSVVLRWAWGVLCSSRPSVRPGNHRLPGTTLPSPPLPPGPEFASHFSLLSSQQCVLAGCAWGVLKKSAMLL